MLVACVSTPTTPKPTAPSGVYVGQIGGSDALIALLAEDGKVTVYTCGGKASWQYLTAWFEGGIANNQLSLRDELGLELSGSFDGQGWSGSLVLRGKRHSWQASKASEDRPAGLYVLETDIRRAGLIVDNTLTTAGVYYGKASGETAAVRVKPELKVGAGQPSTLEIFTEAYGGSEFILERNIRPFSKPTATPNQLLRQAVARVYPQMKQFRLMGLDDKALVAQLKNLALNSAAKPELASKPTRITLPIVDSDNSLKDHPWTVYAHNVRAQTASFGLYVLDPKNKTRRRIESAALRGPSLTFQGVPNLSTKDFAALVQRLVADKNTARTILGDEQTYQASTLSLIHDQLSASYGGNASKFPSVLEGLKIALYPHYPLAQVDKLLAQASYNYLLYNQLHYQPPRVHGYPENNPSPQAQVEPLGHLEDGEWKAELKVVPIMDTTIFDPSSESWLLPEAYGYVESAVNKQNNVWQWTAMSVDSSDNISSSSLSVKTTIHEILALSSTASNQLDPSNTDHYPSDSCKDQDDDDKSFIRHITEVFAGSSEEDNMYKLLWTNAYAGGCAWSGTLNGAGGTINRKYAIGWVGMKDSTADFIKETQVHESGHIVGGRHDVDEFGSGGETTHLHRCRLLGILEVGPEGPSLLSYNRDNPHTLCFAYPTPSATPEKNLSKVAKYLHSNLQQ